MAHTAETLRTKSENLKSGIRQFVTELRKTNAEIVMQIKANTESVDQLNAQHEMTIAKLRADNEALEALINENEKFAAKVEEILGE